MMNLGTILRPLEGLGLLTVSDQLVVGTTVDEAVLLDQAVADALGSEGWAVRQKAAFESSHALIAAIAARLSISGDREIIDLATELFATTGLGQVRFELSATGGQVVGTDLLFGAGLRDRSGAGFRARHTADAFAAGFAAAAASIAYPSDWGSFEAEETECVAKGDATCRFNLTRRPLSTPVGEGLGRSDAEQLLGPDEPPETDPSQIELAARDVVSACVADERGIVSVAGCRLAFLPAAYRAQIVYDTLHLLEKRSTSAPRGRDDRPARLAPVFMELVREASRSGAFALIGSLADSLPLRETFGPMHGDPSESISRLVSVANALGWGALSVADHTAGRRLSLSTPMTTDAVFYAARHGGTPQPRLPTLQGVAEAVWLLAIGVDWTAGFTRGRYGELAQRGPQLSVEEVRSVLSGDRECEVTVSQHAS
jgi:hypothetical protein